MVLPIAEPHLPKPSQPLFAPSPVAGCQHGSLERQDGIHNDARHGFRRDETIRDEITNLKIKNAILEQSVKNLGTTTDGKKRSSTRCSTICGVSYPSNEHEATPQPGHVPQPPPGMALHKEQLPPAQYDLWTPQRQTPPTQADQAMHQQAEAPPVPVSFQTLAAQPQHAYAGQWQPMQQAQLPAQI